jgi:hypothetical protein
MLLLGFDYRRKAMKLMLANPPDTTIVQAPVGKGGSNLMRGVKAQPNQMRKTL